MIPHLGSHGHTRSPLGTAVLMVTAAGLLLINQPGPAAGPPPSPTTSPLAHVVRNDTHVDSDMAALLVLDARGSISAICDKDGENRTFEQYRRAGKVIKTWKGADQIGATCGKHRAYWQGPDFKRLFIDGKEQ